MKLNELVCPSCGLKCLVDTAYTTCDSCNTYFYAYQSRSVDNPVPLVQPNISTIKIYPCPTIQPYADPNMGQPIWMVPIDGAPPPYGPTVVCGTIPTGPTEYQVLG